VLGVTVYASAPPSTSNVRIIAAVPFPGGLARMLWNTTTVSFRHRVTPDHLQHHRRGARVIGDCPD
jgi:hypothetical protein